MATLYLPKIAEADHDTLRNFIKHYPANSYDKWLYLQSKQIANWESGGTEHKVVLVELCADDFIRYQRETGARADVNLLTAVASAKGTGKFK